MEKNDKNIGVASIELYTQANNGDYNWGHIECTPHRVLVGMYEDGEVARKLFLMNKCQVKQLANALLMLSETMDDCDL